MKYLPGQDIVIVYEAFDKETLLPIRGLQCRVVELYDPNGVEKLGGNGIQMDFNETTKRYEGIYHIPSDAKKGIWKFKIEAEGNYLDIEEGEFEVV